MSVAAVVLAAGSSARFGRDKLSVSLGGVPVWRRAFEAFLHHPEVDAVGLVGGANLDDLRAGAPEATFVVAGGATRRDSAHAGLLAVPDQFETVLIHDGARPFVDGETISRVIAGVARNGAAYPGIPVTDTVRSTAPGSEVPPRESLVAAQTPQGARRSLFLAAYAAEPDREVTDDIALVEALGHPVECVPGDPRNRKITRPEDITLMTIETRTGLGYDIHAFSSDPARPMWLGGVEFPEGRPGLDGHSDADALLHAVVDALLGAVSRGDIGEHFPNTDPRWAGEPSGTFVRAAAQAVRAEGWTIVNVDVSVLAERPKLGPRRLEMQRRIAELMELAPERVSVKATTNEGLGSIGRGEGIAAFAVATLQRPVPGY